MRFIHIAYLRACPCALDMAMPTQILPHRCHPYILVDNMGLIFLLKSRRRRAYIPLVVC